MASEETLRAVIVAVDRTAGPLAQIGERLVDVRTRLTSIGGKLSEFAEETGLKQLGEHASEAFEKVKRLGEGFAEIVAPIAAAASVAGLFEIAKSTAEFGEQLKLGAVAAGLSTEALSGWHYAAKLANVDVQQLDRGLQYLNRNIAEAAMGKSKDVQTILTRMGFSNAQGHLVATADALRAVAAEAKHLVDSGNVQLADAMMSQLFGQRSGMQLLPLFAQGPEAINKILESAKEHGIALTKEQAEDAAKFAEGYKEMEAGVFGLKIAIGSQLFPVLNPVIKSMTEWIDANREWISTKIGDAIRELSDWVRSVDWKRFGRDVRDLTRDLFGVIGTINDLVGTKTTIIALGLAFTDLGRDVVRLGVKLVALPIAKAVADFATLAWGAKDLRTVMIALNLAMDANPIFEVIAAATALAAIGYEVYKNWKDVKDLFNGSDGVGAILKLPGGDTGYVDPNTGQFVQTADPDDESRAWAPRAPLVRPGASAGGAADGGTSSSSSHEVNVNIAGVPRGSQTSVRTIRKGNSDLNLSVGYAMGMQ